eukprot:365621-Chlamydomonas_euryale.AAC.2
MTLPTGSAALARDRAFRLRPALCRALTRVWASGCGLALRSARAGMNHRADTLPPPPAVQSRPRAAAARAPAPAPSAP